MRNEKSCGAVVFYEQDGHRTYLMEHMIQGHTAMCKGHVEGTENEHETAAREIMEETGIHVSFLPGFRETTAYSPREGVRKEVIYFLAKAESVQTAPQPEEVTSIAFMSYSESLKALTYADDRQILQKAEAYLNTHPELY